MYEEWDSLLSNWYWKLPTYVIAMVCLVLQLIDNSMTTCGYDTSQFATKWATSHLYLTDQHLIKGDKSEYTPPNPF